MFKCVRSAFRGLLVVTSFVSISAAKAQTNVAAIANNPLAQGYSSDIGYGSSNNGPLDGNTNGGYDFHSAASQGSWWYVDLAQDWSVSSMTFYNRTGCWSNRIVGAQFALWGAVPNISLRPPMGRNGEVARCAPSLRFRDEPEPPFRAC